MRIVSGPVGRERVHFEAPPRDVLETELARFLVSVEHPPLEVDGIVRAGIAHAWFEVLHPFEDGNGRVGRAIVDLLLARDAGRSARVSSVSSRFLANRGAYYAELERFSSGDLDATRWLVWFLGQVAEAGEASRATVGLVLRRARFWMAHGRDVASERQRKVLARMLEVGPGQFEGGMTTRKYVRLAQVSPATAQRDLATLAASGCLRAIGSGRSVRYELVEP